MSAQIRCSPLERAHGHRAALELPQVRGRPHGTRVAGFSDSVKPDARDLVVLVERLLAEKPKG